MIIYLAGLLALYFLRLFISKTYNHPVLTEWKREHVSANIYLFENNHKVNHTDTIHNHNAKRYQSQEERRIIMGEPLCESESQHRKLCKSQVRLEERDGFENA